MEIEQEAINNEKKKINSYSYYENINEKEERYNNSKLLLSDGIFGSKNQGKYEYIFKNDLSSNKKNNFPLPNCRIISSLFSIENLTKSLNQSIANKKINHNIDQNNNNTNINNKDIHAKISPMNDTSYIKENNPRNLYSINYKIYNIKESSLFHIKIFGKNIKYFPIFINLTEYEKFICYNPIIDNNPNFEIISPNYVHKHFSLKDRNISAEKLENLKEKYVKHLFTKRNIIFVEEIFKYLFEEIKLNLSCINVQSPYDDILTICSNLINNINEIIDDIVNENINKEDLLLNMNKSKIKNNESTKIENINNFEIKNNKNEDSYCIFNNSKIKKNFILNDINSKGIENNSFEYDKNRNQFETNIITQDNKNNEMENNDEYEDLSGKEEDDIKEKNNIKIEEKNKKETFSCPYCSRIFTSHCGLGGHMSKRHPKKTNQK